VLRQPIFLDEFDYRICEEILGESAKKYGVPLYAYCLMPNHWHLLVEAPTGMTLIRMLQRFSSTHARTLRKKQQSQGTGAVYQSRYRAHAVQKGESFLKVRRYIEQNPVKAGLCPNPKDWPWSSASAKVRPIEISQATFAIPRTRASGQDENWDTLIESALYGQRPLGELDWQKALQDCSQQSADLGLLAA
jgi:putative transposase